jgi:hypothetical protein
MPWASLADIVYEFELKSSPDDSDGIRRELLQRLANVHPDKTGTEGTFSSDQQREVFLKLQSAVEFLDRVQNQSKQVVPLNQIPAIIEAAVRSVTPTTAAEVGKLDILAECRRRLRRHNAVPKITSATIAGICVILFGFLNTFKASRLYELLTAPFARSRLVAVAQENHDLIRYRFKSWCAEAVNDSEAGRFFVGTTLYRYCTRRIVFTADGESMFTAGDTVIVSAPKQAKDRTVYTPDTLHLSSAVFLEDVINGLSRFDTLSSNTRQGAPSTALISARLLLETLTSVRQTALLSVERDFARTVFATLILTSLFFVWVWTREQSDERWVDHLVSDAGLIETLTRLCRRPPVDGITRFSDWDLAQLMSTRPTGHIVTRMLGSRLKQEDMAAVVDLIIEKLLSRKVVMLDSRADIHRWFVILPNIVERYSSPPRQSA